MGVYGEITDPNDPREQEAYRHYEAMEQRRQENSGCLASLLFGWYWNLKVDSAEKEVHRVRNKLFRDAGMHGHG